MRQMLAVEHRDRVGLRRSGARQTHGRLSACPDHSLLQEDTMRLQLRRAGVVGAIAVLAVALGFASAFAQGTQTGTLSGTVTAIDGAVLPGVSVTLSSHALQGTRQATSDAVGAYHFRALPPGQYKLAYALPGFADLEKHVTVALGGTTDVKATMAVAAVQESVEVVG